MLLSTHFPMSYWYGCMLVNSLCNLDLIKFQGYWCPCNRLLVMPYVYTGLCRLTGMEKKAAAIYLKSILMSMIWADWSKASPVMQLMPQNMETFHGSLITGEKIYFSLGELFEQDCTHYSIWLGFPFVCNAPNLRVII